MRRATSLVLLLLATAEANASVAAVELRKLATETPTIVVATVESIRTIEDRKWAFARVTESVKGSSRTGVLYLAQPTWTCDTSTAREGEEVLLFLDPATPANWRGEKSAGLPPESFFIAWSGRGMMPVRQVGDEKHVDIPSDVLLPDELRSAGNASDDRTVVLLSAVIRWLHDSGFTAPREALTPSCAGLVAATTDDSRKKEAVAALERLGPTCAPDLLSLFGERLAPEEQRVIAMGILCRMTDRPNFVDVTVAKLSADSANADVQQAATILLRCVSHDIAVPSLRRALMSPHATVRQAAIRGSHERERVEALLPEILDRIEKDPTPEVRCWSTESLEVLESDATRFLPFLERRAAAERDEYVRNCVVETIQIIERGQAAEGRE